MKDFTREFHKIKDLASKIRGLKFEQLFYDIFEDHGILHDKSYKNEEGTQQIDGSVEINNRIFIVESKWEETQTLASGKLMTFIGKINSKIEGTLGLFISYKELNERTIRSARAGIRQNCIIIHSEDNVLPLIRGEVSVADYAWYLFTQASTRGKITAPISEYLKSGKQSIIQDKWDIVREALLSNKDNSDFEEKLDRHFLQIDDLPRRAIVIYPKLREKKLYDRINYLLDSIIEEEDYREKLYDALVNKLCKSQWLKYANEDLLSKTKDLSQLDEIKAEEIAEKAMKHLREREGNWDDENDASRILDFVYDHLSDEYKAKLACAYVTIYCDKFRKDRYEQKQMAEKVFQDIKPEERWAVIKDEVAAKVAKYKSYKFPIRNNSDSAALKYVIEQTTRHFERIIKEAQPKNFRRQIIFMFHQAKTNGGIS